MAGSNSQPVAAAATDPTTVPNHRPPHPPPQARSTPLTALTPAAAAPTSTSVKNNSHASQPETYSALVTSVASFLAVSIHQILYLRSIYPQYTFLPVRQFNHPVRQSRHPKVCTWVSDACTAVESQLLKCTVTTVSVVILSVSTNRPLERYTFDMTQFPNVGPADIHTPFDSAVTGSGPDAHNPSTIDLEAQFRAVLARLASACARLTPLPQDEEYLPTLHILLRPDADAPAGVNKDDQMWIAADPGYLDSPRSSQQDLSLKDSDFGDSQLSHRRGDGNNANRGSEKERSSRARAKTVPVRTVDAGEVKLEVWVEEAKGKFEELDRIHSENPP